MIEVVFTDSIKGSMKVAKDLYDGKLLGGSSQDVITVRLNLDMGLISDEIFYEERKKLFFDMQDNPISEDEESINKDWEESLSEINRLKECAKNGEHIRIWYSTAPYSICGFYYVLSLLNEYSNDVSGVKLPAYKAENDQLISYVSWSEVPPKKLHEYKSHEKVITQIEKFHFTTLWNELKEDNSNLRAEINGNVTSVPDDFYDYYIRINVPDVEFEMARLIGQVMGRYQFGIGDWLISQRIIKMIENGELKEVSNNEVGYRKRLKKTRHFL